MKKLAVNLMILLVVVIGFILIAVMQNPNEADLPCEDGFVNEVDGGNLKTPCYTPVSPTDTVTLLSATKTPRSTVINTPELLPNVPTTTPTASTEPTATMIYLSDVDVVPGIGVGVISDSNSEPYQVIGRGTADSYAWTELLQEWRGVNFGTNYEYVAAVSGDRTNKIDDQIDRLEPFIENGEIETILIWIGINDTNPMCDASYSESDTVSLEALMLNNLDNGIFELLNLGMTPASIYMVDQPDVTTVRYCRNAEQLAAFVTDINVKLAALADNYNINFIDSFSVLSEMEPYTINDDGDLLVDGEPILNQYCDKPNCLFLSDDHGNTAFNGFIANAYFAEAIGIEKLNDSEIVRAAGLK